MHIERERPALYGALACAGCLCGAGLFHALRFIGKSDRNVMLGLLTLIVYLVGMIPSLALGVASLVRHERPRTYGIAALVCSVGWLFVSLKWIVEQLNELDRIPE